MPLFRPAFSLLVALFLATAGCGTSICDEAADVLDDVCEVEPSDDGDRDEGEVRCTGETEDFAQCVVDNPDEYCAFLDDPVDNGDNAYTDCVAAITGAE